MSSLNHSGYEMVAYQYLHLYDYSFLLEEATAVVCIIMSILINFYGIQSIQRVSQSMIIFITWAKITYSSQIIGDHYQVVWNLS